MCLRRSDKQKSKDYNMMNKEYLQKYYTCNKLMS